ncbi:LysR family transcriptional regulator [Candidatus Liberibacter africanus]|uniref:Putative transcription regulator protein n=1 Tax=Candidatus Liberibacter africanus PTSAPSY TaxID=1277257 RepID=A0A0G3I1U3_LIBAF|nr:LysR family transcriptional regulator [Candidatus Liberibacter africanus]AKK19851.1 putative transcription regulator protein [Candidatus Liberibacter africanus PTSAPSY]QTP63711.1 LysR family transcriptional regulator [Candidatus Liberibacter africanus]
MSLDWDKLRFFYLVARSSSFTQAAEQLNLSQSSISRHISRLEAEVGVKLFYRHARGLTLTEQGTKLHQVTSEVYCKLENAQIELQESSEKPSGKLRIATTIDLGQNLLHGILTEFLLLHPDIKVQFILDNKDIDISMDYADCAIRLQKPIQPALIQRKLVTINMHAYASPQYIKNRGEPLSIQDLDKHNLITFGDLIPKCMEDFNWLATIDRPLGEPRVSYLQINSYLSIMQCCVLGSGIALLPDYIVKDNQDLVRVMKDVTTPSFAVYFCYPDALKNTGKLKAFRDFIVLKSRDWKF